MLFGFERHEVTLMRIVDKFNNLKIGAKRICVGLMILSLLSTATGIGSIFAYADGPTEGGDSSSVSSVETGSDGGEESGGSEEAGGTDEGTGGNSVIGGSDEGGEDAAATLLGAPSGGGSSSGESGGASGGNSGASDGNSGTAGGNSGSSGNSSESAGGSSGSSSDESSEGGEASSSSSGASGESDGSSDASSGASSVEHVHVYSYTPNNNGTHIKSCSVEGCTLEAVTESCEYEDGSDNCKHCGAPRPVAKISLSEVTFTLNAAGTGYVLSYDDNELASGTDYTVKENNVPAVLVGGQEYNIVYEGCGRFEGEVTKTVSADVTVTFDGSTELKTAYYYCVVIESSDGYQIDTSSDGAFGATSYQYSTIGENQSLTVYFKNGSGTVIEKQLSGITVLSYAAITVKYNGEDLKDWYNSDVKVTADGYLVSDNSGSGFAESYMLKKTDADSAGQVSKLLYFKNDTTPASLTVPVSVMIDQAAPTGSVFAGHSQYLSLTFESEDTVCGYENSRITGTITGEDDKSGLAKSEYFISDTFYDSENTLIAAMQSGSFVWTNGNSFTINQDQKNYVYVKLTDNAGNEAYISSHAVICDTAGPAINEISTSKVTDGVQIVLRGTDTLGGIDRFIVIEVEKDGTESEPSKEDFDKAGIVFTASNEEDGSYVAGGTLGKLDVTKTYVFYCTAVDYAGNYSQIKSKTGYSQDITLDIRYNGDELKEWYNESVTVTVEDYSISEAGKGKYQTEYVMSGSGTVTKKLDFRSGLTGVVKTYDITVKIDEVSPTGKISCDDYGSKKFQGSKDVAFYTNGKRDVKISYDDEISGVKSVQYIVSESYFGSAVDFAASMADDKSTYKTYANGSAFSFDENKSNYIYVKITDNAGNETYLSTGRIVCDTKAPTMGDISVSKESSGSGTVVTVVGKDDLSGINRFKLLVMDKDNSHEPSKDEIFNNGLYLEVTNEADGVSSAKYTLSNVTEPDKYNYYAAAVDRAGNISDIKTKEAEGSSSSAGTSSGGSGASSGTGSSGGLAPAPSGIAGGGGSAGSGSGFGAGGRGSASGGSGTANSTEYPNPLEREINRLPYIADATGSTKIGLESTGGWDRIVAEIKKADLDATIEIEMSGLSEIPFTVFAAMAGRPITIKFKMPNDVTWIMNGSSMIADDSKNMDLNVRIGSKSIPDSILSDIVGTNPHFEFEIPYTGPLGFTAILVFPVGTNNAGMYANLYHYQEANKDMSLEKTTAVNSDGYAELEMSHASSFSVVLTSMALIEDSPVVVVTADQNLTDNETLVSTDVSLRIPDLFGLRGRVRLYLFIIGIISAVLCIAILFMPGLQLPKKEKKKEESIFDQFQ